MKKSNKVILTIAIIWSAIVMLIVFCNIYHPLATVALVGYGCFLVGFALYSIILVVLSVRKQPKSVVRQRFRTFFIWFFGLSIALIAIKLLRKESMHIYNLALPLGMSFGIAFLNILGKKEV